jgi:hypothetical protein
MRAISLAVLVAVLLPGCSAFAASGVKSQRLVMEASTVHCLGARWYVSGDDNGNASVRVEYRAKSEKAWHEGLPMFRVGDGPDDQSGEKRLESGDRDAWPFALGNFFAGSVFDLKPDTAYELRMTLADPDGGKVVETRTARTKRIPTPPKPKRVLHVIPGDGGGTGTKADPFRGLAAADAAAKPGDLFLVHAGVYPATFEITQSGTAQAPIVWRGAGDGEAVIDGKGRGENGGLAPRGVSAHQRRHLFFQGISVRNSAYAFVAHGASDLTIQRCHFYQNEFGFTAHNNEPLMRSFYVSDNLMEGPSTWPRTQGIEDARAVQVSGEGHDICYNRIRGFGDGVDIMGSPTGRAIDFYGNEISECTDDAIELDYGQTNVRAFRNRITNCFEGISTQPLFGGPAYIFRNAMYNLEYTPFKMHNNPSGVLLFHNTIVKTELPWPLYTNAAMGKLISRNNLFVGGRANHAMEFSPKVASMDCDYDGFAGGPYPEFARLQDRRFVTFDEFRAKSGIERHATWLGETVPFATGVTVPADRKTQFQLAINDLRLAKGSKAIDAGVKLPNLNDGYAGKAPDLGAYELGAPLPWYGPREERP